VPAKLLIADDSTTIQKVFERTFPPEEFTLSFVNNGEEALAKARAEKPNLIIADINMPAKNGFELCEDLKKDPVLKGTPILLLIGILDDFDEDESRRVGADGFIVKPFEANAAISKVREALAKEGSALPKEGPAEGEAQEVTELADITTEPTATPPPQKKGAEDILDVAEILGETPGAPTPPTEEKTEEIMELADITTEPTATPPPQKKGAEDILDVAEILGETPGAPTPPTEEKTEEVMELADITTEPSATPTPPPQEKATEDIFELPDITAEPSATPTPPPQEKKEDDGFVLQSSLRELEEELKAEFPEDKTELEEELKMDFPQERAEVKEDLSVQQKKEGPGGLDLELPFDDAELEPRAKDADWTGLFGELGVEEPGQESKNERLGTILDESTSELEKIEGLASAKDEETKTKEEFAEKFIEDFEPVFEPGEDLQHIDSKKDLNIPATEDTEDLAEKVVSAVGHELKEVVDKVIKEKVPQLVRQEMERLKKE
jgi:CheY-like chemotaxis protein